MSDPNSVATVSWSPPATSACGLGHPLYLLVPTLANSTRKDSRKQQHHLSMWEVRELHELDTSQTLPTGNSMCNNKRLFRDEEDAGLGLMQPKKESR